MARRSLTPIQQLIRRQMQAEQMTYQEVANRGKIPKATVYSIATRQLHSPPRPETLERLAVGLGVPLSVLMAAAAESAGYHKYEEPVGTSMRLLVASLEELTPEQRAQVSALVDAMLGRRIAPDD